MQLSIEHAVCFLCTPKCASTSIENAIAPLCDVGFTLHPTVKHVNAMFYVENIEPVIMKLRPGVSIETFCLMREPTAWVNSWYRYRTRPALLRGAPEARANSTKGVTFEQFVDELLLPRPRPFANIGCQKEFMSDERGDILVDRIFRVEDIGKVEAYLSEKFDRPIVIPQKNVSPGRAPVDLRAYRERLFRKFAADFELYDSL